MTERENSSFQGNISLSFKHTNTSILHLRKRSGRSSKRIISLEHKGIGSQMVKKRVRKENWRIGEQKGAPKNYMFYDDI